MLENVHFGSVESRQTVINIENKVFDYCQLKQWQTMIRKGAFVDVCFDLTQVESMTTAAFAFLLIMKRELMRAGGDLHVKGLQGQPKALCRLLKLCGVTEGETS